jgi:hypothetical protein
LPFKEKRMYRGHCFDCEHDDLQDFTQKERERTTDRERERERERERKNERERERERYQSSLDSSLFSKSEHVKSNSYNEI